MELVYEDNDDVEMGVSNPMDKYSNYKVIEKDTEFINPLAGLKQQLKGTEESSSPEPKTEESSSTLSASPEPKTEESSSTLSASPESEPEPGFKRIRSMPILSVLSDVSSLLQLGFTSNLSWIKST